MEDTFFLTVVILTCAIASADSVTGQQQQLKEKRNKQLSPLGDDLGSLHVFIQVNGNYLHYGYFLFTHTFPLETFNWTLKNHTACSLFCLHFFLKFGFKL